MTPGATPWRWLAVSVVTYSICHHLGALPDGLGPAGHGTRVADWVDLAVPALVLVPTALALRAADARPADWVWWAFGAVVYAEGHGIHLAGNSVGNVDPGPTAHLWDEPVGHHVWFAGLAIVVVALTRVLSRLDRPPGPVPVLLAAVAGITWGTNAVGGGTEVMSGVVALFAAAYAVHARGTAAVLLLPAAATSVVALGVALAIGW